MKKKENFDIFKCKKGPPTVIKTTSIDASILFAVEESREKKEIIQTIKR